MPLRKGHKPMPRFVAALMILLVTAISFSFKERNMGTILALLREQTTEHNVTDQLNAANSIGLSKEDHATLYQKRMSYYRTRYNYHPAESKFYLRDNQSILPPTAGRVGDGNNTASKDEQRSSICGSAPTYDAWFGAPAGQVRGRSANSEDSVVYNNFFKGMGPEFRGTFVEMGAFDGIHESNSLFFETCAGWDGILVEANPRTWGKLVANRPRAHRFHFAPSCNRTEEDGNATLQFIATPWTNSGVASPNVKSAYTDTAWAEKEKLATVPCGTLTDILRDILPGGRVNFFSLDVEGAEPMVVGKAIDFDRVFIEVLMVEQFNNKCPAPPRQCESRDQVRRIMRGNNYTLYDKLVRKSDVYVHPRSDFQLPASIKPLSLSNMRGTNVTVAT